MYAYIVISVAVVCLSSGIIHERTEEVGKCKKLSKLYILSTK